jgi:hypothetical protein
VLWDLKPHERRANSEEKPLATAHVAGPERGLWPRGGKSHLPDTLSLRQSKKWSGAAEAVVSRQVTEGNPFRERAGRNGPDTKIFF